MELSLFNTRTRRIEAFVPITPGQVRLYCCGPTVYNYAHIGNLRTYLFEDCLRRALVYAGYRIDHVMNVTDVGHLSDDGDDGEDKMIKGARERGLSVWQIAELFTQAFFDDCRKLNIQKPEIVCKATDHIADMIDLISRLEAKGFTYAGGGNIYFDVAKFAHYGELALLDRQTLLDGARIEVDAAKHSPRDFALWFTKSKFEQQAMVWDSPWGRGYPGWHVECSAMSLKYLGDHFDIHCGGVDHIPVHHTNEIAQTEAATGEHPWVNVWMHAEFLLMNKAKMSKSAGTFMTVAALAELGYEALDYRYFCLQAHYRTQLTFSTEAMDAAKAGRANLVERVRKILSVAPSSSVPNSPAAQAARNTFQAALADDLNLPKALAVLSSLVRADNLTAAEKVGLVTEFDTVLGLDLVALAQTDVQPTPGFSADERTTIESLIAARTQARAAKNWAESDVIRDQLLAMGVSLKDGPGGTTYAKL